MLYTLLINFNETNSNTISQCFLFLSLIFHSHPCTTTQQRTANPAISEVAIFKHTDLFRLFINFNKNNYVAISHSWRFFLTLTLSKSMHYKPRTNHKSGVYTQKLDRTKGFWTPHPPSREGGVGEKVTEEEEVRGRPLTATSQPASHQLAAAALFSSSWYTGLYANNWVY